MKRILALAVVFLLLAAMACGAPKEAPTRANDEPAGAATPEAAPKAVAPVPDQETLTEMELCHLDEASVSVNRIRWYRDDCLAIDYEISNPALLALAFEPRLVSINDWAWFDWYGRAADWEEAAGWEIRMHQRVGGEEAALSDERAAQNPSYLLAGSDRTNYAIVTESAWQGTCYYSLSDAANRAMELPGIYRLSLEVSLSTELNGDYYGEEALTEIPISDAGEPDGALPSIDYPADERYHYTWDENGDTALGLVPLGYDDANQTLLLYAALPFAAPADSLRFEAAVNGSVFYSDLQGIRFPNYEITQMGSARQAIVCLPLQNALEELEVSAPSMLAVNVYAEGSRRAHLWNVPVNLDDAEPEGDVQVALPIVFESDEIVLRYAGLSQSEQPASAEGSGSYTFLVLEAQSLLEEEALDFWLWQYELELDGETYRCDGPVARVRPGGTARWYGRLAKTGADGKTTYPGADTLRGEATFEFVYERPWDNIEDSADARTGPLPLAVTLP